MKFKYSELQVTFCCKDMENVYLEDAIDNNRGKAFIKHKDVCDGGYSILKFEIKYCPFCAEEIEVEQL